MNKAFLLLGATLLSSAVMAAEIRVGVVDYTVINSKTTFFKEVSTKLQSMNPGTDQESQNLMKQITEKQAKMQDPNAKLTDVQKKAIEKDLQDLSSKMENLRQAQQTKFMDARKKMMDDAIAKLQSVVKEVSDAEHCALVLRKESVAYAPDMVDITDKVVVKLGAAVPKPSAQLGPKQSFK